MAITLLGSTNSRIEYGDVSQIGGLTTGLTVAIDIAITGGLVSGNRICGQWTGNLAEGSFLVSISDDDELTWIVYGPSELYGIKTTGLNLTPGLYKCCFQFDCATQTGKIFVNGVEQATTPVLGGAPSVINNGSGTVFVGHEAAESVDGVDGSYEHFAIWGQKIADSVCQDITGGVTDRSTLQASTGILYSPLASALDANDDWNGYTGVVTNGTTTGGGAAAASRNRAACVLN